MAKTKILSTVLSDRDRYLVWHRLFTFQATSLKEERHADDLWATLMLDRVRDRVEAAKPTSLDVEDFSESPDHSAPADLDREELSFLLSLLTPSQTRPIITALGRYTAPLRRRLESERDKAGINATAAE